MMSGIKRSLKLIKYGYALKSSVLVFVLFFVLGTWIRCIQTDENALSGIVCVICGVLMLMQVHYYLLYANFVSASPRRKLLELTIPNVVSTIAGLLGYAVLVIVAIMQAKTLPQETESIVGTVLIGGLEIAALLMCFGAAYKYYVLSLSLFFVVFFVLLSGGMAVLNQWNLNLDVYSASGISLLFVAAGIVLSCVLRRALYKRPLSKIAAGASLRKAMQ